MDVVAMYPSVQREPALREKEDQLSKDPKLKERTKWKPKQIKRLAEVCFETHFVFIDGKTYTQYDGTPIGKSISGLFPCKEQASCKLRPQQQTC